MGEEDIHIDDMARTKRSIEHTGFKSIETVGKMVLFIILRFWRACSAAVLTLFLLYWLYGGVVIFLLFTAAVLGALYHYQDALLYFPEQPETSRVFVQNPSVLGLPYENLYLKSQDGTRINVVFIKQPPLMQACAPTVLFCHGNAGNVGHRLVNAKALHSQLGCNVLLLEYRGYGKSEGSPSEYGFQLDTQAALEYLLSRKDIDTERIVVFGRSLGGAVALDIATLPAYMDQLFAVIVENTFTSIPAMAGQLVSGLHRLPYFCFKNKFNTLKKVQKMRAPTLFLSGMADQLIPPKMMTALYQASGSTLKKLEKFESGTHNDTWQCYGYLDAIAQFLYEVQQARNAGIIGSPVPSDEVSSTTNIQTPSDTGVKHSYMLEI